MTGAQNDIANRLDALFSIALRISNPISSLLLLRRKIVFRGLKPFDEHDILTELGKLQQIVGEIHSEMLRVESSVKRIGKQR